MLNKYKQVVLEAVARRKELHKEYLVVKAKKVVKQDNKRRGPR